MSNNQAIPIDQKSLQALDELLKDYPESAGKLPNLKMETKNGMENNILSKWIEEFHRWLLSNLPESTKETTEDVATFSSNAIEYIILGIIALVVIYFIARYVAQHLRQGGDEEEQENNKVDEPLIDDLRKLLDKKRYKAALRLRWKIFLNRFAFSNKMTPNQYIRQDHDLPDSRKKFLLESYLKMFSTDDTSKESYSQLDEVLSDLELKKLYGQQ